MLCYTAVAMDDRQLVTEAQAGSQAAFCELVERYKAKAMSIAIGLLGNFEEARDVSQEAFVQAYRALPHFRAEATFATWLYRIIVNECHDALRARARAKRWLWLPTPDAAEPDTGADFIALLPGRDPSAQDVAHDREVAQMLRAAIMGLSPRQRAAMTLRYLQEMSLEDVAQTLGCATGTVKAQLSRALRHLRAQLNGRVEVSAHDPSTRSLRSLAQDHGEPFDSCASRTRSGRNPERQSKDERGQAEKRQESNHDA